MRFYLERSITSTHCPHLNLKFNPIQRLLLPKDSLSTTTLPPYPPHFQTYISTTQPPIQHTLPTRAARGRRASNLSPSHHPLRLRTLHTRQARPGRVVLHCCLLLAPHHWLGPPDQQRKEKCHIRGYANHFRCLALAPHLGCFGSLG
jgi:hypothetical protein